MGLSPSPPTYSHGASIKLSYLSFSLSYRAVRSSHLLYEKAPHNLRGRALLFSRFQRLQSAMVGKLWQRKATHTTAAKKQKKKNTRRGQDKT